MRERDEHKSFQESDCRITATRLAADHRTGWRNRDPDWSCDDRDTRSGDDCHPGRHWNPGDRIRLGPATIATSQDDDQMETTETPKGQAAIQSPANR